MNRLLFGTTLTLALACGGDDSTTGNEDSGGGGPDTSVADSSSGSDSGSDSATGDASTDAAGDGGGADAADATCPAPPDSLFVCGGSSVSCHSATEYCLGGVFLNSCKSMPAECDCASTHDC